MIHIKPSASIRKNYNEISELCKRTGEPVYLTKNGEGDLVVMDIETFAQRESMLRLRENLISSEEDRLHGKKGYSVKEVSTMMKDAVKEILDGQEK
jgi:prevent-host-death family protein